MRYTTFLLVGLSITFWAWAACSAPAFPTSWSPALKSSTEQLITLGIDSEETIELTTKMEESGCTEVEIIHIQRILSEATEEGLPSAPLFNKAYEGLAKNVPTSLLLGAMEQVQHRYREGRRYTEILSQDTQQRDSTEQVLVSIQAAGLDGENLEHLVDAIQTRIRSMEQTHERNRLIEEALLTARDLSRLGAEKELTSALVSEMVTTGASSVEIKETRNALAANGTRSMINKQIRICLQLIETDQSLSNIADALRQQNMSRNRDTGNSDSTGSGSQSGNMNGGGNDSDQRNQGDGGGSDSGQGNQGDGGGSDSDQGNQGDGGGSDSDQGNQGDGGGSDSDQGNQGDGGGSDSDQGNQGSEASGSGSGSKGGNK